VRALYDFVTEVAGELCFNVDDVLVLTNQVCFQQSFQYTYFNISRLVQLAASYPSS
jgi:hypothetical protein